MGDKKTQEEQGGQKEGVTGEGGVMGETERERETETGARQRAGEGRRVRQRQEGD